MEKLPQPVRTTWRDNAILGLRFAQLLCIAASIVGGVWSSSDLLLNTILVSIPVAPMSVLLMVYGTFGVALCEITIRIVRKKE